MLPPLSSASPYTQYSILDTLVSHICTFAQEHRSDLHLCTVSFSGPRALSPRALVVCPILDALVPSGPRDLRSSCPRCISPLSPCHRAHMPPRGFAALTFAPLHAAPPHLHFFTVSLPTSDPHLAELGFEVGDGLGVGARSLPQFLQHDLEINGRLGELSRPHGDIAGQRRAAIGPR